eukprot:8927041-Pyramimonas_sp.AAC.1
MTVRPPHSDDTIRCDSIRQPGSRFRVDSISFGSIHRFRASQSQAQRSDIDSIRDDSLAMRPFPDPTRLSASIQRRHGWRERRAEH